jgi:hypothetical protein
VSPTFETYENGADFIAIVDFSASELDILSIRSGSAGFSVSYSATFEDPAFTGLTMSLLSFSLFPSASDLPYSVVEDTISFNVVPGLPVSGNVFYTADFSLLPVSASEPFSGVPFAIGLTLFLVRSQLRFSIAREER